MYPPYNVVQSSRQEPQRRNPRLQPMPPPHSRISSYQAAEATYPYQLQVLHEQDLPQPTFVPPQHYHKPPPCTGPYYDDQLQDFQEMYPVLPPFASPQRCPQNAPATTLDSPHNIRSGIEQVPYFSQSPTTRASAHNPRSVEDLSALGANVSVPWERDDQPAIDFMTFSNGSDFDMTHVFGDLSLPFAMPNSQDSDNEHTGVPQHHQNEPSLTFEPPYSPSYHESLVGMGQDMGLSYFNSTLGWGADVAHMQVGCDGPGQAAPIITGASFDGQPPYQNLEFHWETMNQDTSNAWFQQSQYQPCGDVLSFSSNTVWPPQMSQDDVTVEPEQSPQPMHPSAPYCRTSSSEASDFGYRVPHNGRVRKYSTSEQTDSSSSTNVPARLRQIPVHMAVPRAAKRSTEKEPVYFCALGCKRSIGRRKDIERHHMTTHLKGEKGLECLLCPTNKQGKKYGLKYNVFE